MELHEIRYFLTLCETLNFTRAAEVCNVSQPALTRAIQKMEDELGGLVFSRERNNTHLTELGRMLKPHLEEVVARTQSAKETARRFLKLDGAHLSLGVLCSIGPVRFVSFLSRFKTDHPGITVTLTESTPDRLSEMLLKGELDVTLMAQPDGFEAPLQAQALYSERFIIACSPGHRFARSNAVSVCDLDGESYLNRINCEYRDRLGEICRGQGARLVSSYRSEREDWILTMVAAGMGICFLPEFAATVPGIVTRLVVDPSVEREVCLVTVAGRRWSPPVSAFVKAARAYRWPESTLSVAVAADQRG